MTDINGKIQESEKLLKPMSFLQITEALKELKEWDFITSFSVGGFEYLGFNEMNPGKMLIISSQKSTILDCDNAEIRECDSVCDENSLTALCSLIPDSSFSVVGQYEGTLPQKTMYGDYLSINLGKSFSSGNKQLCFQWITFTEHTGNTVTVYIGYPVYVCGFSPDGNYFVLADDVGIFLLKRKNIE